LGRIHQLATAETKKLEKYYGQQPNKETDAQPTIWQSSHEAWSYISKHVDVILFDCDGVLYRTASPCPGASECIQTLLKAGKQVYFVTNNAGVNRAQLLAKLERILQLRDKNVLTLEQMVTSSYASAIYLQSVHFEQQEEKQEQRHVHVIGSMGLCQELQDAGFCVSTLGNDNDNDKPGMTREELSAYDFEKHHSHPLDALVVGHDTELNFRKLCVADNLLKRNPKALFVATNMDSYDVVDGSTTRGSDDERHILGNGATVVALEYSSKRKAINVGKPSQTLWQLIRDTALKSNNKNSPNASLLLDNPSRCLFVGDRLDTDIRFANDNGMKSMLVMTGVTDASTLLQSSGSSISHASGADGTTMVVENEEPLPDFVLPHVGMMVKPQ